MGREQFMVEYRRGVVGHRRNELWHSHTDCESYPTKMFALRTDKPAEDELCPTCKRLAAVADGTAD